MVNQLYALMCMSSGLGFCDEIFLIAVGTQGELANNRQLLDAIEAYEEHTNLKFVFKFNERIIPFGSTFDVDKQDLVFPWYLFELPPVPAYDVTKSTAHHKAHLDLITHAINDKKFAVTVWDNKANRECIARNCTDLAMLVSILEKVTPEIYKNVIFEFTNQNINASTSTMFMGNVSVDLFEDKLMNVQIPPTNTGWIREWKESFYNRGLGKQ